MLISNRLAGALALAVLTAACSGDKPAEQPPANPPAQAAAAPAGAPPAADSVGVAECDQFLRKYEACVGSKVPESSRPMLTQSINAMKAGWKQAAATPNGKAALAMGCTQSEQQAKASMSAYGCSW